LPLLKDPDSENIIKTAYDFASVERSAKTIATATELAAKIDLGANVGLFS
jgi:hypothetical protein